MPLVYNNLVFTRNYQKPHKYVLSRAREKKYSAVGFLLPDSKFKMGKKNLSSFFMSSFKREIRKFHVVVCVKEMVKNCTKKCDAGAKLLFYLLNLLLFLCSRCILNCLIGLFFE